MSALCSKRSPSALATGILFLFCASAQAAPELLFTLKEDFTVAQVSDYNYTAETTGNGATLTADLPANVAQILHIDAVDVPGFTIGIHDNQPLHFSLNEGTANRLPGEYANLFLDTIQYFEVEPTSFFSDGAGHESYEVALRIYGRSGIVPEPSGMLVLLLGPLGFVRRRG